MNRREFLQYWAAPAVLAPVCARTARSEGGAKRLVVVMLRGAVDGLSIVVPYGEQAYYDARPTIAIPRPGSTGGAIPLDGHFALHPALSEIAPLWKDRSLAFIHAAGSPDPTRSHFDAQLFIENGTPGRKTTPDGWMNRLLGALPGPHGATEALSIGPTLPQILKGRLPVANLPLGSRAATVMPVDRPDLGREFDQLYSGSDALAQAYHEGRAARSELIGSLAEEMRRADNGAPSVSGLPATFVRLAGLLRRDHRIRLVFASCGGWDTHVAQGSLTGQLAYHLRSLGQALAALAKGLGPDWTDTVIVVLSEFGRTVHENDNHGTDHGHGNVVWVLGGNVCGGRIWGDWPGLAAAQLYQRRDLAVTTDYRAALAAILERHLRLGDKELAAVFPDMPAARSDLTGLLAA